MALKCYYAPVYVDNIAPEGWSEGVLFQASRCPGIGADPIREFADIPGATYRLLTDEVYLICDHKGGSSPQDGWTATTLEQVETDYPGVL